VENSFIKKDSKDIINFSEYSKSLSDRSISENESIRIYNELIALFIILSLYVVRIHILKSRSGSVGIKKYGTVSKLKMDDKFDIDEFVSDMRARKKHIIASLIEMAPSNGNLANLALLGLGISTGATGAVLPFTIPIAVLTSVVVYLKVKTQFKPLRTDLLGMFKSLYRTIFSQNNTISALQVRFKLKYWGLKGSQVQTLFSGHNLLEENTHVNAVYIPYPTTDTSIFTYIVVKFIREFNDEKSKPVADVPLLMPSNANPSPFNQPPNLPTTAVEPNSDPQQQVGGRIKKKNTRKLKKHYR
jgi:hypothetical protein